MRADRRSRRRKYLFASDPVSDAAIFKHDAEASLRSRDAQYDSVGQQLRMQRVERVGASRVEHRHRFRVQHQHDGLALSLADCLPNATGKVIGVEEEKRRLET